MILSAEVQKIKLRSDSRHNSLNTFADDARQTLWRTKCAGPVAVGQLAFPVGPPPAVSWSSIKDSGSSTAILVRVLLTTIFAGLRWRFPMVRSHPFSSPDLLYPDPLFLAFFFSFGGTLIFDPFLCPASVPHDHLSSCTQVRNNTLARSPVGRWESYAEWFACWLNRFGTYAQASIHDTPAYKPTRMPINKLSAS